MAKDPPIPRVATLGDRFVERTLDRLRGEGPGIDCPETHARAVLARAFSEHADAVLGRPARPPPDPGPVKFLFRERKAIGAVQAFLEAVGPGGVPVPVALRALYAAEVSHLLDWGRPIHCDAYRAMPTGPVPEMAARLAARDLAGFALRGAWERAFRWEGTAFPRLGTLDREAADDLSETDRQALARAAAEALQGGPKGTRLRQIDRGWRLTPMGAFIDWAVMPDPGLPDHESRIEQIREAAVYGA